MTASASRTAPHSTVDRLPANAVIPGSSLHLRQVIAPASTFQPSTAPLIRRAPAAPPVGTPRGRGAPPVPVTGAAGALPGTLSPANLAAFGTAVTGTSQLARRFAAASGHPPTAAGQPSGNHNATIHRMFELPSPSELFERARSWFTGEPDVNPADPNGPGDSSGRNSVSGPSDPDNDGARFIDPSNPIPGIPPTDLDPPTHSTELAERPRSLRALLRQGGSMTEPTANHQDQQVADALSPREWDQLVDLVVERIEERVRDELSRRGRRFSPGVF
jgi:hypothetical protein